MNQRATFRQGLAGYVALLLLAALSACSKSSTSLVVTVLTDQALIDGHVMTGSRRPWPG